MVLILIRIRYKDALTKSCIIKYVLWSQSLCTCDPATYLTDLVNGICVTLVVGCPAGTFRDITSGGVGTDYCVGTCSFGFGCP